MLIVNNLITISDKINFLIHKDINYSRQKLKRIASVRLDITYITNIEILMNLLITENERLHYST